MLRHGLSILTLLGAVLAFAPAAHAQHNGNVDRYFHYPYYYFPFNYWPNEVKWPDQKIPFQQPPVYMAYPKDRDNFYRYEILENRRYHRGFHFFLDQF
jgi:hypothetical protein